MKIIDFFVWNKSGIYRILVFQHSLCISIDNSAQT